MTRLEAVSAIFCEDIREERSGSTTLVGVMGDNVYIPYAPVAIPKLCIYFRAYFDCKELPPSEGISMAILSPDDPPIVIGKIEGSALRESYDEARRKGAPKAGMISRVEFGGFIVKQLGRIVFEVECDGQKYWAGMLNFSNEKEAIRPTS
jgi:hypothetical protein